MQLKPQFIALVSYLKYTDGGRKSPAMTGIRPSILFPFSNIQYVGAQNFIGTELVYPGDSVKAEITLISHEVDLEKLYPGLDFEFFEGEKSIGRGTIVELLND